MQAQDFKPPHIEGLKQGFYQEVDVNNDTPPAATIIEFFPVSEFMPFLSEKAGKRVEKTFIYMSLKKYGGNLHWRRRVRDKLLYNTETGKWEIDGNIRPNSDIAKYPNEWNAFYRGISIESTGTPLSVIMKGDPARVEQYKREGVHSLEQLSSFGATELESIRGILNGQADVTRAKEYLKRATDQAPLLAIQSELSVAKQENEVLRKQLSEAITNFNQYVESQKAQAIKPKRGRPAKTEEI